MRSVHFVLKVFFAYKIITLRYEKLYFEQYSELKPENFIGTVPKRNSPQKNPATINTVADFIENK